jgi:hypothetical protein
MQRRIAVVANHIEASSVLQKWISLFGFVLLAVMVLLLYGFTLYHAWLVKRPGTLVLLLLCVGLVKGIVAEGRHLALSDQKGDLFSVQSVKVFSAVFLGAVIAFQLKVDLGLGAVVGAGLTALMAALIVPGLAVPAYCGAFVGMTSARLFSAYGDLCLAAAIAGGVYLLTQRSFQGYGGKLGTIAFCGTFVTGFGLKREFLLTPFPALDLIAPILLCAVFATAFTFFLSVKLEHGPVLASGGVALIGGLILPNLFPGEVGGTLAVMAVCASFAGMSSPERILNWWAVLLMGLFTGMIYILSMPLAGGAGGKLGTISFGVALSVSTWHAVIRKWSKRDPFPSG